MTISIDHAERTHTTVLEGVVYEDTGEKLTDHDFVKALSGDIPDALVDDLVQATQKYAWGIAEGYDEYHLFREQYAQIKQVAVREHGLTALELYDRYMPIVEAAILKVTNWGDVTGDFLGDRAREESQQWFIRQICTDSFSDDTDTGAGVAVTDRIYSVTGTGHAYGIVPRVNGDAQNTTYVHTYNDEQMLAIFYYQNDLSPRVTERAQEYINDSLGWRTPFDVWSQSNRGNEGIATRPGCLVVDDNKRFRAHGWAVAAGDVDIFPQGVDIITRNEIVELST
ncbi:MAG: hypothetical protein U9N61_02190 [Euryarchaeota archaeon]|nr:hypothetical protein [Euryarchaeota archaeon]